jgi:hypothetical protein
MEAPVKTALRVAALVAVLFGVVTVFAGGSVIFGSGAKAAGNYVPFVVWFNFLAGFVYVAAGVGLWRARRWGTAFAVGLAVLTALVFAAFGAYVGSGAAYEARTVVAMTVRTALWTFIAALAWRAGRSLEHRSI